MSADAVRELRLRVSSLNSAWRAARWDELAGFFAHDVVALPPGASRRIVGREALVASYRDFVSQAVVHEFTEEDIAVDLLGGTAVATVTFSIRYSVGDAARTERGIDVLVFARRTDAWHVVWRTQIPLPSGTP